jgi:hypothetical protein
MAKQENAPTVYPVLVVEVDHLLEYSEKAVTDRAELGSLQHACPRNPVHTDVVDQVIEFRDRATDDLSLLNGQSETPSLPPTNAAE